MSIQTDDFAPSPQRVLSSAPASPREEALERALRPKLLDEYIGQAKAREQQKLLQARKAEQERIRAEQIAARDAAAAAGGTVAHHHGVGASHAEGAGERRACNFQVQHPR